MGWYSGGYDDFEEDTYTLRDYETPADALILQGPVRAVSRRGPIGVEWWGQQWVLAMERLGMTARLGRGKRYARNGAVRKLEISAGMAYAEVQGSRLHPYRTAIFLDALPDAAWDEALEALAGQAIYAAKLLAGEMPGDIETVFQSVGLSLFPRSEHDIDFECSCPDWGYPCKHAAAVYYLVAEQLDADPFILFQLRGRNREAVLARLRNLRGGDDTVTPEQLTESEDETDSLALDHDLTAFWDAPDINLVRDVPSRYDKPFALRQLGDPPGKESDSIKEVYPKISKEARRWLGLDEEDL
jgi:uncharacterized Zn finger protein